MIFSSLTIASPPPDMPISRAEEASRTWLKSPKVSVSARARFHILPGVGAEQDQFENFMIRQRLRATLREPRPQEFAMIGNVGRQPPGQHGACVPVPVPVPVAHGYGSRKGSDASAQDGGAGHGAYFRARRQRSVNHARSAG